MPTLGRKRDMPDEQHQQTWSSARLELLRALWDEGLSASAIGQRLQVSKNAVVGKAYRLRLPPRPSPIRPRQPGGATTKPATRLKAPRAVAEPHGLVIPPAPIARARVPERVPGHHPEPEPKPTAAAPNEVRPAPILRSGQPRTCAWPLGDPGTAGFRFCGGDAVPARPYCEQYCCRAYVRPTRQASATA